MSKDIQEVEIFGVGTWNGMKFTSEDLQEISENSHRYFKIRRKKENYLNK